MKRLVLFLHFISHSAGRNAKYRHFFMTSILVKNVKLVDQPSIHLYYVSFKIKLQERRSREERAIFQSTIKKAIIFTYNNFLA